MDPILVGAWISGDDAVSVWRRLERQVMFDTQDRNMPLPVSYSMSYIIIFTIQESVSDYTEADKTKKSNETLRNNSHPADPIITLQFLRSAIFYLFTDSENYAQHVAAIQSILRFSPEERSAVERAANSRYGYL